MKKLIFVSLATFLAIALFLAGPVSADDIMEKMIEPIPDETIKALLTKYPDDAQMHLGAAFLFTENENKAEAKAKAIKLAPEYKKIFLIQDLKRISYKKYDEEALKKLEELVKIDPGNAWPHYILAGYYFKKGEKEKWQREMNEALAKERLDDYEVESLRAVFRLLDKVGQPYYPFRGVWKLSIFSGTLHPFLSQARDSARELVKIGKEFEEKGEREKALEYYRKAERIAQQLLLKKPEFLITRLVSIAIRKIAYKEMARFYAEEAQAVEAAVLREQIDLMDAWQNDLRATAPRSEPLYRAIFLIHFKAHMEEIRPEKREEIKAKMKHFRKELANFLMSPAFNQEVEKYLERILNEGEFQARKALPEPEKSPLANDLAKIHKQGDSIRKDIEQALIIPEVSTRRGCLANLKQIGLALHIYANDYQKSYPPPEVGLKALVPKYMPEGVLSKCQYEYNPRQLKVTDSHTTPLVWDKQGNHPGGRNVVFVDGHAEWMPEEEFQKLLAEQKEKYKKTYLAALPSLWHKTVFRRQSV